ncbi:Hypothetical_protein [Hexamita inflata]|uniref:Hypothetical_protein n=1 Tax=Hexamita inflata TaxID=28002 RepID=A0ABP1GV48_9EUKA
MHPMAHSTFYLRLSGTEVEPENQDKLEPLNNLVDPLDLATNEEFLKRIQNVALKKQQTQSLLRKLLDQLSSYSIQNLQATNILTWIIQNILYNCQFVHLCSKRQNLRQNGFILAISRIYYFRNILKQSQLQSSQPSRLLQASQNY